MINAKIAHARPLPLPPRTLRGAPPPVSASVSAGGSRSFQPIGPSGSVRSMRTARPAAGGHWTPRTGRNRWPFGVALPLLWWRKRWLCLVCLHCVRGSDTVFILMFALPSLRRRCLLACASNASVAKTLPFALCVSTAFVDTTAPLLPVLRHRRKNRAWPRRAVRWHPALGGTTILVVAVAAGAGAAGLAGLAGAAGAGAGAVVGAFAQCALPLNSTASLQSTHAGPYAEIVESGSRDFWCDAACASCSRCLGGTTLPLPCVPTAFAAEGTAFTLCFRCLRVAQDFAFALCSHRVRA